MKRSTAQILAAFVLAAVVLVGCQPKAVPATVVSTVVASTPAPVVPSIEIRVVKDSDPQKDGDQSGYVATYSGFDIPVQNGQEGVVDSLIIVVPEEGGTSFNFRYDGTAYRYDGGIISSIEHYNEKTTVIVDGVLQKVTVEKGYGWVKLVLTPVQ